MRDLSSSWSDAARRVEGRPDVHRLAVALGLVRSVIRVVDNRTPPLTVDWAEVGSDDRGNPLSQSYTDFRGDRVAINPLPILDGRLDAAGQVDVSIGQGLHEASHSKETRALWYETLLRWDEENHEVPVFEPMRVAVWLLNIAEDVRVEGITAREWPGFAGYFDVLLDWLWGEVRQGEHLADDSALGSALRLAFEGVRFPGRSPAKTPVEDAERDWWHEWSLDYLAGALSPSEAVRSGLERLAQDPRVEREMAEMQKEDEEERKASEDLRRMLERLAAEGVAGLRACAGALAEQSTLNEQEAEAVERLVSEHLEDVPVLVPYRGAARPAVSLRKPTEDLESRRAYVGRPSASVEAMRAALVFRPARPQHDQKLRRTGEVDDEELWRLAAGDFRVFTERVVEARPDTALGMLVDISGSMSGEKLRTAQRVAQVLLLAAMDSEGVTPHVWAHTGDLETAGTAEVYTIWEPGDPASRLGLLGSLDNGDNYDGFAIALCADRLRQMEQEQKVLLVLSDGYPAGNPGYGGPEAQRHMRDVCRWAASQGVSVIQIAIDPGLRAADQSAMFGEGQFVMFQSDAQVARDLTAILSRYAR